MNVAIYARVSTTDQNCEMQLRDLRDYCQRRGWPVHGEYVDTGFSGAKVSRPALDRLMRDCRAGEVDVVLVWKIDRWGRSVLNLADSIAELRRLKVRFVAITQNIDTDENNPAANLLMNILMSVAEFEREIIRERVKAGIQTAKIRGKRLGRPRACFDRTKAADLRAKGFSLRSIARQLNVGLGTVQRQMAA